MAQVPAQGTRGQNRPAVAPIDVVRHVKGTPQNFGMQPTAFGRG